MRRYFDWLIPLLILMAAIAWRFQDGPLVTELRNKVFDVYQRILPRSYDPKTPVRILAIDEESLKRDRAMALVAGNPRPHHRSSDRGRRGRGARYPAVGAGPHVAGEPG